MKQFLKIFRWATIALFVAAVIWTIYVGFMEGADLSKMNIANYFVYGAMLTGTAFFVVAYSKKSYLTIHAQTNHDATFKNIRPIWRLLGYVVILLAGLVLCTWLSLTASTFREIILFDETVALLAIFFHWRTKYTLQAAMKK